MSVPESKVSNKTLLAMKLNIVQIIAIFMLCLLYHVFKGVRKHPQHSLVSFTSPVALVSTCLKINFYEISLIHF